MNERDENLSLDSGLGLDEVYQYIIQEDESKVNRKRKEKIKDNFLTPDESNTVFFEGDDSDEECKDNEVEMFKNIIVKDSENAKNISKIKPCISKEWLVYIRNIN